MKPYFSTKERIDKLKAELYSWMGTPFQPRVMVKHGGVDCAMFVAGTLTNLKVVEKLEVPFYANDWYMQGDDELLFRLLEEHRRFFPAGLDLQFLPGLDDLMLGDILCFKTDTELSNHSGFYLGSDLFIHASNINNIGVVISTLSHPWKPKLTRVARIYEE